MFPHMKRILPFLPLLCAVPGLAQPASQHREAVNFSKVEITDAFWKPKIDLVATKTLDACIYQTEVKTARIRNFEKVARGQGEKHEGIFYDDSDVFKALEAMAYSLATHPSAAMEAKCDEWIDKIAAAQQPDGYLNTYYTLTGLNQRYTDMSMHEDYNNGHLIEAAVAYYNATGKRKLLDVAIRWADHFDSLFGPGKRHWVTGHQELELALVKLYRVTKNEKYLRLADWLLSERGRGLAKGYTWTEWKDTAYAQDLVPVREQSEITGHAVRAMYMYTGAADVAAITGDQGYLKAMRRVWEDVVFRNMYITGGIGSAGSNEGFSNDYDLPNEQAYCETCASVGMVFWNQRMNLLNGSSEYIDVLERSLYNGALDGLSLSGDRFFYGNPLASSGQHARREWFGTACCPANIARLVASLGDYIYTVRPDEFTVNLFVGSRTRVQMGAAAPNSGTKKGNGTVTEVSITQETRYPLDGTVTLGVDAAKPVAFSLRIRIPGWYTRQIVPGNLYAASGIHTMQAAPAFTLNGKPIAADIKDGYAVITRNWTKGDQLQFKFDMPVLQLVSRPELKQDSGRIALQRGPLVYCVEAADNGGHAWNFIVPEGTEFRTKESMVLGETIIALQAEVPFLNTSADGKSVSTQTRTLTAIPYYTWANRGKGEMQVWLPTKFEKLSVNR
jgi:DUF1680 family protein